MTVKFTNNASTTVATGINTTATSLVVASAAGFPALSGSGDYCYLTIQQAAGTNVEVVKATALSSNTFTIVRAQDGTSAGSWSVSDVVELRVTAALLTDIVDAATHDASVLSVDSTNNRVGVNDTTPSVTLDISGTDAIALPVGTTAERPTGAAGRFRYNSSLSQFEGYTDAWGAIGGGGTNTFTTDTFTANGSLVAFNLSQTVSSANNLLCFIDGVFQTQDAYSIATASGTTTLTFSAAPANGRKIVVYSVAAGISGANLNIDSMTGDGSDVTLTLTINTIKENTQVFIDGVYQSKSNYSISGTTLTFSTAPPAGSAVECVTMTQTEINVPVDGTITSAKLSGALTTPSDLTVTGTVTADGLDVSSTGEVVSTVRSTSTSGARQATLRLNVPSTGGDDPAGRVQFTYGTGYTVAGSIEMSHTNTAMKFLSGTTEAMRISGSNVGIGVAAPAALLHVNDPVSGNFGGEIRVGGTGSGRVLRLFQESATDYGLYATGTNSILKFGTAGSAGVGTERMRLSGGNLLVGKTSAGGVATVGAELRGSDGYVIGTASSDKSGWFGRNTSDGDIVGFYKDGTAKGSIGTTTSAGGSRFAIGAVGDPGIIFAGTGVFPATQITASDNTNDFGSYSYRWKNGYFSGDVNATNFTGIGDGNTFIGMSGSDIMRFSTGGVERMRISAAGVVTTPYQPSFQARLSANQAGFNSSGSFGLAVGYNVTDHNVGNHFSTSTGLFTAPVAGLYFFEAAAYVSANAQQSWYVKNGGRVNTTDKMVSGTDPRFPDNATVLRLAANDTVGFHPYVLGNTNVTIINNANHTYFKGYLIG